jgi:hypothetical protein
LPQQSWMACESAANIKGPKTHSHSDGRIPGPRYSAPKL